MTTYEGDGVIERNSEWGAERHQNNNAKWTFTPLDSAGGPAIELTINPTSGGSPVLKKRIEYAVGYVNAFPQENLIFDSGDEQLSVTISGTIFTPGDYSNLVSMIDQNDTDWELTDDLDRVSTIYITSLELKRSYSSTDANSGPWRHDWTMTYLVVNPASPSGGGDPPPDPGTTEPTFPIMNFRNVGDLLLVTSDGQSVPLPTGMSTGDFMIMIMMAQVNVADYPFTNIYTDMDPGGGWTGANSLFGFTRTAATYSWVSTVWYKTNSGSETSPVLNNPGISGGSHAAVGQMARIYAFDPLYPLTITNTWGGGSAYDGSGDISPDMTNPTTSAMSTEVVSFVMVPYYAGGGNITVPGAFDQTQIDENPIIIGGAGNDLDMIVMRTNVVIAAGANLDAPTLNFNAPPSSGAGGFVSLYIGG